MIMPIEQRGHVNQGVPQQAIDESVNTSQDTAAREPRDAPRGFTDVQVSIRSLLIVMAVVAVGASALGLFIRRFPAEAHLRLAAFWAILIVGMLSVFVFQARRRYLAERHAGEVLFRLLKHSYVLPRGSGFVGVAVSVLCLLSAPAMWFGYSFAIADPSGHSWVKAFNYGTIYAMCVSGAAIGSFWWRRVRIGQNGVVERSKFYAWKDFAGWYWNACDENVAVLKGYNRSDLPLEVPAVDRAAIESLLNDKFEHK